MEILWGGKIRVIIATYITIHHPCQSYLPRIRAYCDGFLIRAYPLFPLGEGRDEGKMPANKVKKTTPGGHQGATSFLTLAQNGLISDGFLRRLLNKT